jgi:hypothetical protein
MLKIALRKAAILILLAATPAAFAGGTSPALQTGLWQFTTTLHMQDMPVMGMDPAMMATLPPAARQQMATAMSRINGPHSHKTCLTADKLRQGFSVQDEHNAQCTHEVLSSTASRMEMRAVCADPQGGASSFHVVMEISGQHVQGHFEADSQSPGGPHQMTGDISGTYLGADCAGSDAN